VASLYSVSLRGWNRVHCSALTGLGPTMAQHRRKWATERNHMPGVDLAQAGGWIYREPQNVLPTSGCRDYFTCGSGGGRTEGGRVNPRTCTPAFGGV
jgi:hypothetical protein